MPRKMNLAVALVVAHCAACAMGATTKTTYVVGGWQAQTADVITKTLAPLFQDYLTQAVGSKLNPPAKFVFRPVDMDATASSRQMIINGELDFLYTLAGGVACKSIEFSWVPVSTQRTIVGTAVVGIDAISIFSRLNNTQITTADDLRGKRLGCGLLFSGTTYYRGYQLLADHGLHLYRDLAQVQFYGSDYESYYQAVLRGDLDFGFATTSWITKNHPNDLGLIRIIDRQDGLTYEGDPYPGLASSLSTTYSILASEKIGWQLKRKVLEALQNLTASHPAMKLIKLAGWTVPASYASAVSSLETSGVAYKSGHGNKICRDGFTRADIFESITCPSDHYKVDYNTSAVQCDQEGLPCPRGVICFCRPCRPKPQNIFRWELVVALCSALYGVGIFYLVVHYLRITFGETVSNLSPPKCPRCFRDSCLGADDDDCCKPSPLASKKRFFSPTPHAPKKNKG